jgi:hypothetical protein
MSVFERGENPNRGKEGGAEIGDRDSGLHRRAVGLAGDRHDAGDALRHQIEAALVLHRSRLSIAGDGGVDQPRIEGRQRRVVESQPGHDTGPEILDQDVGGLRQAPHDVLAARGLEIDDDAALATIDGVEARTVGADRAGHRSR